MRVLITALPGYGHLYPLIPLAQALRAAGHEVAFACSASMSACLLPLGLPLFAAGPYWREMDFTHDTAAQSHAEIALPLHQYLAATVVPQMLRDIDTHIERWRPDIILSNEYERTGCALAEQRHIPFVLASSGPRLPKILRRQWHAPLYAQARSLLGLAPDMSLDYSLQWLHLCFTPPGFFFKGGVDYQPTVDEFAIRPQIFTDAYPPSGNVDIGSSNDVRPLVLCTLGTVFNKNAALIKIIIEAFADAPYRLIATLGPGFDRATLGNLPDNVRLFDHLPLASIASQVSACITHGGTATLMTLLQAGVPCLLLPQGADHQVNALTCIQQGLAVAELNTVAEAANCVAGKVLLTPALIRQALDKLLQTTDYRKQCADLRKALESLPPMSFAVELLEQMLARARQNSSPHR